MLCFYDFIVIKIPFVVCAFAHTRLFLSTWRPEFFVCFSSSVQTFALLESQQTKRTERNGKNWCKHTNRFHLNFAAFAVAYCSLCCARNENKVFRQTIHSFFWCFSSIERSLRVREPTDHCACPRDDNHPSPRHSIISLFHYSLIEITKSKANDAQFSLWLLKNPDAV